MAGIVAVIVVIFVTFVSGIGACMRYAPEYTVWSNHMEGKAQLAKAEQNRQIAIYKARSDLEAADYNAQAEIKRAQGAAKANEIMSLSLNNPGATNYLRWKYIQMLEINENHSQREIIYLPVEGMLPLPEAGRAAIPQHK